MAKTATAPTRFKKRSKVVARTDLRDVPEGTPGRIVTVNGLTWIRYWVRFENGVYLGSIDENVLATEDEWKRHLAGEDVWGVAEAEASDADGGDAEGGAGGGASGGDGATTPSGTVIPQLLLDRAAAARKRLAA